jgi:hypothetical protein
MVPITALLPWVRTSIEVALSPDNGRVVRPKYRKARPYLIIERSS